MRIAFVLTQSLESPSGLGRYWPLAKEIAKQGHEIHIITLHHNLESLHKKTWQEEGVYIHYVAQMHVKKVGNEKIYFSTPTLLWLVFIATLKLTLTLFKLKPEMVHLGKPHPMNGFAGWVYTRLKRVPLYLDCDDYEAEANHFSGHWQRKIITWFENHLPLQATAITVNTRFSQDRIIGLGYPPEKIVFVPNAVDRARFTPLDASKIEDLRKHYHLKEKQVIVYIGSLNLVARSIDLLLEAFAKVASLNNDAILMLVGGGKDRNLLIQQSQDLGLENRVIHVGKVPPADVPAYYQLAVISVDPVQDGGAFRGRSPLKIYESFALGVPVITGDVGDRRAVLQDDRFGLLTLPGDVDTLAEAMLIALNDSKRIETMQAALHAEQKRGQIYWDVLADDFIEVYNLH